jgi:hypothetical protein
MKRIFIAAPILIMAALGTAGCPPPPVLPSSSTSASPTASIEPAPVLPPDGTYSDLGIEVLGGSLFVEVKDANNTPIKDAVVKLYGPTLATAPVNEQGQVTLAPLSEGAGYRLVVEANGYATLQVGNIEIKKKTISSQRPKMSPGAVLKGRVLAEGKPVAGAVVSDGLNSTLTDGQGAYELKGVALGSVTPTASKSRYQVASKAVNVTGQTSASDLALASAAPVVYFDGSVSTQATAGKYSQLKQTLTSQGWTIQETPPAREGVWVLVSPSTVLGNDTLERLVTFVAQGGKLVILGDWGGFSGFNNLAANNLAHVLGLHFNPDLLRDPAITDGNMEWIAIRSFRTPSPISSDVKSIQLYQSSSLFALAPMSSFAQTGKGAYRVQANAVAGIQNVGMGGPYKAGKAIALGDSSAWSDADSDGDSTSNLKEADNARFVTQLFDW